jgi:HK97 family phage major capsid protein
MNDEEKKALREELENFKKNLPTYATPEDVKNAIKGVEEKFDGVATKSDIDELKEIAEKQGLEMQKFNEQKVESKSIRDQLWDQRDALLKLNSDKSAPRITIKTDITRASVTNSTLGMRLPDVGQLARQRNVLQPLFAQGTVGPNSNGVVRYVDQTLNTNAAAGVTEAAEKPEGARTWQEYTLPIEVYAETLPVTNQALSDVDMMATEINTSLLRNLADVKDQALWNGSGTPPAIKGIYTYADEYVAAAAGISDANIYDLIIKMQESIAGATSYMPNFAIMNIADINLMRLKKDANENYILPPFASQDGSQVGGITIIASNSVTADTMLVGDFDFGTLYSLGGLRLDVGWIDKQFKENMVTILAEERFGLLVRTVHTNAFAKETGIAAALVTLAT